MSIIASLFFAYMKWVEGGSDARAILGIAIFITIGLVLIVGIVLLAVWLIVSSHIPTDHLNGVCRQYYTGVVSKYGTSYSPVKVCP